MAITIVTEPDSPQIAKNTIEFVVTSDNVAEPNFKFVFDIKLGATLIARVKKTPAPSGSGYFDLSSLAWHNMTDNGDNLTARTIPVYEPTFTFKNFGVFFGEEYGATPVIYPELEDTSVDVIRGHLDYLDYVDYDPLEYNIDNTTGENKFLTLMPRDIRIGINQYQWINFYRTATNADYMVVVTYDQFGAEIETFVIHLATSETVEPILIRLEVGPDQMNDFTGAAFIEGASPVITDEVFSYDVYIRQEIGTDRLSEIFTFNIDRKCYRESRTFYFRNSFGAYESVQFNGIREQQINAEKNSYTRTRALGETPQTYRRFKTDLNIKRTKRFSITSNYITPEESEWLKDLFASYDVYITQGDSYVAVRITDQSYEPVTRNNTRMINAEFTYEYTY